MTTLEAALWTAPSAVGFIAGSMVAPAVVTLATAVLAVRYLGDREPRVARAAQPAAVGRGGPRWLNVSPDRGARAPFRIFPSPHNTPEA